ncbi:anthranilate synthase component I family protein [Frankia sp. AgB1.9]|uniref:anthranilate synthase component I family protein n=1 Tax=unclassified Frankia TaxID=2632575 RepID=UPI00193337FD|nr:MULTISPECIES: anthranilate synthase component I family protein [unclassified Frankia]MBL7493133.1 anthranilate synthase component I family protein [Frankia sp. AgW1.1]MBL7553696.1 anthranilate synthase component I family protein [Frankia sp. AgB1.9]MBL7621553.1 anthranilate synthase component I family protein [Frankia sp. AgB1.8]
MQRSDRAAPAPAVTLVRRTVQGGDPLRVFLSLREWLGADDVFLLESLAGPSSDRRSAVLGFGPLFELSARGDAVSLSGNERLVAAARAALLSSAIAVMDGEDLRLVEPDGLWEAARELRDLFALAEQSATAWDYGFVAVFGYDSVRYVEELPRLIPAGSDATADVVLRLYNGTVVFDLASATSTVLVVSSEAWPDVDLSRVLAALAAPAFSQPEIPAVPPPLRVQDDIDEGSYQANVSRCLEHIAVGDLYQVQIGHEITVRTDADDLDVYLRLRARNPSPYMGLLPLSTCALVGASPELFVRVEGDRGVMRPIAGTAARSGDPDVDARRIEQLRTDEKECAEHVMLVDLCRNDLGRVARPATVEVNDMMVVENFSHVFHLVSEVRAQLAADVDVYDVIRATFPAGTMTGAPKIRAMEIIEEIETRRRGIYAGAFGLIGFGGYANLGLAIRTLFRTAPGVWRIRASAGVVADSKPDAEWRETLAKMSAGYWALTGGELL